MSQDLILMSMNGGLFIMIEMVEKYLTAESFKVAGIQAYRGIEFASPHYFNQSLMEWFNY